MDDDFGSTDLNMDVPNSNEIFIAKRSDRFLGALIDAILGGIVMVPFFFITGFFDKIMSGSTTIFDTAILAVGGVVIYALLHGYLLANEGQTIGKKIIGTRIVSIETHEILPLGEILALRYLPTVLANSIPLIGPFLSLADALFIFRSDKRCIHDIIAKTIVVDAD